MKITPDVGWIPLDLQAVWDRRDLLWILAGRDVKVRYKQTALGVAWVVLQPLIAAAIFSLVFGRFANLPSDGAPYLLFAFTGLMAWKFFEETVSRATNSVVGQAGLITKTYFPRVILPLSSAASAVVDLGVTLGVTGLLMAGFAQAPTWSLLLLPLFLLLTAAIAIGVGLWLAALNVYYRDFGYAMPFLLQAWIFATPVAYATALVPEQFRPLYALNPLVAAIEGTRGAVLGRSALTWEMIAISIVITSLILMTGLMFFRQVERRFADVI